MFAICFELTMECNITNRTRSTQYEREICSSLFLQICHMSRRIIPQERERRTTFMLPREYIVRVRMRDGPSNISVNGLSELEDEGIEAKLEQFEVDCTRERKLWLLADVHRGRAGPSNVIGEGRDVGRETWEWEVSVLCESSRLYKADSPNRTGASKMSSIMGHLSSSQTSEVTGGVLG